MAINYIAVKGYIKDGELHVELPNNVIDGEIEVKIPVVDDLDDSTYAPPLTDEEIDALMKPNPKTGAEIAKNPAIGSWANKGITNSVEWVAEQRHKRRDKTGW